MASLVEANATEIPAHFFEKADELLHQAFNEKADTTLMTSKLEETSTSFETKITEKSAEFQKKLDEKSTELSTKMDENAKQFNEKVDKLNTEKEALEQKIDGVQI